MEGRENPIPCDCQLHLVQGWGELEALLAV